MIDIEKVIDEFFTMWDWDPYSWDKTQNILDSYIEEELLDEISNKEKRILAEKVKDEFAIKSYKIIVKDLEKKLELVKALPIILWMDNKKKYDNN